MPNRFRLKPYLQIRIILLTIVVAGVVLGISDALSTLSSVRALENEIGSQTAMAASRMVDDLRHAPSSGFTRRFHASLDKILDLVPNITRVYIYAQSGPALQLLASNSFQNAQKPQDFELSALSTGIADTYMLEEKNGQRRFAAVNPFRLPDGRAGFVTVISSLTPVDELVAVHSRIRIYTLVATVLLLVAAITWVFQTNIYRSIHHLIHSMNLFEQGRSEVRAREQMPGEFGDLARHLNHMLDQISHFHDSMKQQIQAATGVLAQRNRELETLNLLLYETQKRLIQAEILAVVGQLTATFAHEIGSPLSAVSTHLQILLEDNRLSAKIRERLRMADAEINRVCEIVESLLANTRRPYRPIPVDLGDVVHNVMQLLRPTLESRHVDVDLTTSPGALLTLGNPDQLQQLFLNLFNNSLDAMPSTGRISVVIQAAPAPNGKPCLKIEVGDTGAGIPSEALSRIFEPFFTTKEFQKGTGLGLAICQDIVRRHGGRISVESPPNRSARFTILLPEMPPSKTPENSPLRKDPTL